ncbi:MAG: HzsA-related protein, partial [Planctomycetota bacterium]
KPTGEVGYRKNIDSFHIYEIGVDGTGLRQITTGRFHDVHPIYLADGRICFTSTRGKSYSMCQPGLASALFTMNADGSDIRRIEFSTLADMSPYQLDDGSILFTRWEYQDKSLFTLQSLWTVNPDGTRVQLYYGNTITNPNTIWQAKPIPGTGNVLCILGPHHGNPVGALGIVDRSLGVENPGALENITRPYGAFRPSKRVHAGGGPGDKGYYWAWRDPWPVTGGLFLAAYGGPHRNGPRRYRIHVVDPKGSNALVIEDEKISCFNPVPLLPRKRPRLVTPIARSDAKHGTFFLHDVYKGIEDKGIERGRVRAIRILTHVPKPCNMRGRREFDHDPVVGRASYYLKICYGTVPVEADGSAHFKAPVGVELYFEAVDADGKELCRMGSVTQIMPGEHQSCVGCHEPRAVAGPVRAATALERPASEIAPPPWGHDGPIDFVRDVQPVFDRHCVKCHSGPQPKKGLDLSGDKSRYFNMAYGNLIDRKLVHYIWLNKGLTDNFKPLETGSHKSKLVAHLEAGHNKIKLTDNEKRRLYTWIDANCPYYGTYDNTRPGTPGSRDTWSDQWRRRRWYPELAKLLKKPTKRLPNKNVRHGIGNQAINLTHPEWSAILTLNLARSAGGQADDRAARYKTKADPQYVAVLELIRAGKAALDAKPRIDMAGAKPSDYPTDYGGLYFGFAGP